MKKILFGTANKEKIRHVRHILSPFSIEIIDPDQLGLKLDVTEDGDTPEKNAIKKAIAYCQTSGLPSFAIDSGLVINGLSNKEQPDVFVRRICPQQQEVTDQQIIDHYIKKYVLSVAQLLAPGTIVLLWFTVRLLPFFIVGKWKCYLLPIKAKKLCLVRLSIR